MMRLWVNSYAKRTPVLSGATVSVIAHAVIIAAWAYGTKPAEGMAADSFANRVYYIPPPDKVPGQPAIHERVTYVNVDADGLASGDGRRTMGDERPVTLDQTVGRAEKPAADSAVEPAPPQPGNGAKDSVYTIIDVDTAVVRSANSAAPAYPLKLLAARIMGYVNARYVVDTTGFADTTTFRVLKSTNPEFETAVRDALPYMRFTPAKIGSLKVRQLVEQQFSFRITNDSAPPDSSPAPRRKPSAH